MMQTYDNWKIAVMAIPVVAIVIALIIAWFERHKPSTIPPSSNHQRLYGLSSGTLKDHYDDRDDNQPSIYRSSDDYRWVEVFGTLRRVAFAILVGPTRSGKTVIAHNLIKARISEHQRAIIFDPDARPGHWPGAMVYGAGDNWEHMNQGFALVEALIQARRKYRAGDEISPVLAAMLDSAGLTIYPDDVVTVGLIDASDTTRECRDQAVPILKTLALRGAKLGIHLIIDVQNLQAATLNLERATHVLHNARLILAIRKDKSGARWCIASGEESPTPDRVRVPSLPAPKDEPRRGNTSAGIRPDIDTGIRGDISPLHDALRGPVANHPSNTIDHTDSVETGNTGDVCGPVQDDSPMSLLDPDDESVKAQRIRKTLEKAKRGELLSNNDLAALMRMDRNLGMAVISAVEKSMSEPDSTE